MVKSILTNRSSIAHAKVSQHLARSRPEPYDLLNDKDYDLYSHAFWVNDLLFVVPPTQISIDTDYSIFTWKSLRSDTTAKVHSGQGTTYIKVDLEIPSGNSILNVNYPNPERTGTRGGLVDLILQFKYTPFCYIENAFIRSSLGLNTDNNMAAILSQMSMSTVALYPGTVLVELLFTLFNYRPYAPDFVYKKQWDVKEIHGGYTFDDINLPERAIQEPYVPGLINIGDSSDKTDLYDNNPVSTPIVPGITSTGSGSNVLVGVVPTTGIVGAIEHASSFGPRVGTDDTGAYHILNSVPTEDFVPLIDTWSYEDLQEADLKYMADPGIANSPARSKIYTSYIDWLRKEWENKGYSELQHVGDLDHDLGDKVVLRWREYIRIPMPRSVFDSVREAMREELLARSLAPTRYENTPVPGPVLEGHTPFNNTSTNGQTYILQRNELVRIGLMTTGRASPMVPYRLVGEIIRAGNFQLLGLFIGTAGWGVSGVPDDVDDPSRRNWDGVGDSGGKRLTDPFMNGSPDELRNDNMDPGLFGIAHFRGGRDFFFTQPGFEGGPSTQDESNYYLTTAYLDWAREVLTGDNKVNNHRIIVDRWVNRYWDRRVRSSSSVEQVLLGARISSSTTGTVGVDRNASIAVQQQQWLDASGGSGHIARSGNNVNRAIVLLHSFLPPRQEVTNTTEADIDTVNEANSVSDASEPPEASQSEYDLDDADSIVENEEAVSRIMERSGDFATWIYAQTKKGWIHYDQDVSILDTFYMERSIVLLAKPAETYDLNDEQFSEDRPICHAINSNLVNLFKMLPLNGHITPTAQFLGGNDARYTLGIMCNGLKQVQRLQGMRKMLESQAVNFRFIPDSWSLRIENPIVNVLGHRHTVVSSDQVDTVPGSPGMYHMQLDLIGHKPFGLSDSLNWIGVTDPKRALIAFVTDILNHGWITSEEVASHHTNQNNGFFDSIYSPVTNGEVTLLMPDIGYFPGSGDKIRDALRKFFSVINRINDTLLLHPDLTGLSLEGLDFYGFGQAANGDRSPIYRRARRYRHEDISGLIGLDASNIPSAVSAPSATGRISQASALQAGRIGLGNVYVRNFQMPPVVSSGLLEGMNTAYTPNRSEAVILPNTFDNTHNQYRDGGRQEAWLAEPDRWWVGNTAYHLMYAINRTIYHNVSLFHSGDFIFETDKYRNYLDSSLENLRDSNLSAEAMEVLSAYWFGDQPNHWFFNYADNNARPERVYAPMPSIALLQSAIGAVGDAVDFLTEPHPRQRRNSTLRPETLAPVESIGGSPRYLANVKLDDRGGSLSPYSGPTNFRSEGSVSVDNALNASYTWVAGEPRAQGRTRLGQYHMDRMNDALTLLETYMYNSVYMPSLAACVDYQEMIHEWAYLREEDGSIMFPNLAAEVAQQRLDSGGACYPDLLLPRHPYWDSSNNRDNSIHTSPDFYFYNWGFEGGIEDINDHFSLTSLSLDGDTPEVLHNWGTSIDPKTPRLVNRATSDGNPVNSDEPMTMSWYGGGNIVDSGEAGPTNIFRMIGSGMANISALNQTTINAIARSALWSTDDDSIIVHNKLDEASLDDDAIASNAKDEIEAAVIRNRNARNNIPSRGPLQWNLLAPIFGRNSLAALTPYPGAISRRDRVGARVGSVRLNSLGLLNPDDFPVSRADVQMPNRNSMGNWESTLLPSFGDQENDSFLEGLFFDNDTSLDYSFTAEGMYYLAYEGLKNLDRKKFCMRRAFPTFKVMFIEYDSIEKNWQALDDFYSYSQIESIRVVRSRKVPADVCTIDFINIGGSLSGNDAKIRAARRFNISKNQGSGDFLPGQGETNIEGWQDTEAEQSSAGFILQEGTNILVRLGYNNDPVKLEDVFIGRVVSVSHSDNSDRVSVIAQTFATELTAKTKGRNRDEMTEEYRNTFELLAHMMFEPEVAHFGRSVINRNIWFGEDQSIEANEYIIKTDTSITLGNLAMGWLRATVAVATFPLLGGTEVWGRLGRAVYRGIKAVFTNVKLNPLDGPQDDNIYVPDEAALVDYSWIWDGGTISSEDYSYYLYQTTIWDVFQEMTLRHPGWIASPVPYGNSGRMTMFFGLPSQRYWANSSIGYSADSAERSLNAAVDPTSGAMRDPDATQNYLNLLAQRYRPFRQYHMITSQTDIISNNMVATSHGVYNTVSVKYWGEPYHELESAAYATEIDEQGTVLTIKSSSDLEDSDVREAYTSWPNCRGEGIARRYAVSQLTKYAKEMYKGSILVLGNARMKPYDLVYMSDTYNDICGPIEIEEVVHQFSHATGFVTEIVPDAFVIANDIGTYWSYFAHKYYVGKKFARYIGSGPNIMPEPGANLSADEIAGISELTGMSTNRIVDPRNAQNQGSQDDNFMGMTPESSTAIGAVAGGAIGGVLGGPAGAVAGASLGSSISTGMWMLGDYLYYSWCRDQQAFFVCPLIRQGNPWTMGISWSSNTGFIKLVGDKIKRWWSESEAGVAEWNAHAAQYREAVYDRWDGDISAVESWLVSIRGFLGSEN